MKKSKKFQVSIDMVGPYYMHVTANSKREAKEKAFKKFTSEPPNKVFSVDVITSPQ